MRFESFSFGSIHIDGNSCVHDIVLDRGKIRRRKKRPSKRFRAQFGHTPLSIKGRHSLEIRPACDRHRSLR